MMPSMPNQNPADFKFENMTREELKKIEQSMKKPEFMGLLNEYMVEISDPKNREQYDQYLRQMESQGELPKNMKLVELTPHFCIRTSIVSQKNKKHNMKFFINFCGTQYLDEPTCEPSLNKQGKTAFGWKVPNSMGKIRYDQDKSGTPCQVADVAFNSKAFEIIQAQSNLPFRKNQFKSMMIAIGLQCAQKQLGERKQTLSKDYDILKNLKCKGGKPALLPLRYIKGKAYNKGEGPEANTIQRDTQGRQTKLQKQINQLKTKNAEEKKKQEQKTQQDEMQEEELQDKKVLIKDLDSGVQQPKYSSIYTYPVDYSEFLQDPSHLTAKKVPSHFTVEFKLPRVEGMEQIGGDALNVNQNRIVLKIGQKYFIDLPFETFKMKYKLLTQKVKAKFDKKKKCLKLIFPIDLSVKYHQEEEIVQSKVQQISEQNNEEAEVVQNQTWKNKVLQVTEPSVDLKIIEQTQVKEQPVEAPQKKLIEEIDEDDYPEEAKNQNSSYTQRDPQNFEEALQQQRTNAFSLRKYYQQHQKRIQLSSLAEKKQEQIQQKKANPNELSYVFQQTSDKVVLVIKMLNYRKEDVKVVYDKLENSKFYLQWNLNQSGIQDVTKIHILSFRIVDEFVKEIKRVEIVFRVGFLAIFINKTSNGRFWQKDSIKRVSLCEFQNGYEGFVGQRKRIQELNNERAEYQRAQESQMREKQQQKDKKSIEALNDSRQSQSRQNRQSSIPQQLSTSEQNNKKLQGIETYGESLQLQRVKQSNRFQGEYFNYNNLPPQFLQFNIRFIDELD